MILHSLKLTKIGLFCSAIIYCAHLLPSQAPTKPNVPLMERASVIQEAIFNKISAGCARTGNCICNCCQALNSTSCKVCFFVCLGCCIYTAPMIRTSEELREEILQYYPGYNMSFTILPESYRAGEWLANSIPLDADGNPWFEDHDLSRQKFSTDAPKYNMKIGFEIGLKKRTKKK